MHQTPAVGVAAIDEGDAQVPVLGGETTDLDRRGVLDTASTTMSVVS